MTVSEIYVSEPGTETVLQVTHLSLGPRDSIFAEDRMLAGAFWICKARQSMMVEK